MTHQTSKSHQLPPINQINDESTIPSPPHLPHETKSPSDDTSPPDDRFQEATQPNEDINYSPISINLSHEQSTWNNGSYFIVTFLKVTAPVK